MSKGSVDYDDKWQIFENKQKQQEFKTKRTQNVRFNLDYTNKNIANDKIKNVKQDKGLDI